jgi:hypothetical protein
MKYIPSKDRSEEFGWKKVCDEHTPTKEEQDFWGKILVVFSLGLGLVGLLVA